MDSHEHRLGMEVPIPTAEAAPASAEAILQWRVHLARQRPGALVVLACIFAASMGLAFAVFGHPLPVGITIAALFASVSEFVLPITYQITPDGVSRSTPLGATFLAWKAVRRCQADTQGIRLSPLPRPSQLDAFRSVTLRLPADDALRARVLAAVRVYLPQADPEREGQ